MKHLLYASGDATRPGVVRLELMSPRGTGTHFPLDCGAPHPLASAPLHLCRGSRSLAFQGLGWRSRGQTRQGQAMQVCLLLGRGASSSRLVARASPRHPLATGPPVPPNAEGREGREARGSTSAAHKYF